MVVAIGSAKKTALTSHLSMAVVYNDRQRIRWKARGQRRRVAGRAKEGGKLARPWNVECFGIVEFLWETNGLVVAHSGANDNERSERRARTLDFGEERESKVQDKRERSQEEGVQGGEGRSERGK